MPLLPGMLLFIEISPSGRSIDPSPWQAKHLIPPLPAHRSQGTGSLFNPLNNAAPTAAVIAPPTMTSTALPAMLMGLLMLASPMDPRPGRHRDAAFCAGVQECHYAAADWCTAVR
eukprot:GHRR01030388.1.p2 GENE.GHRR01030388.1~~GHRR01030388.1.p2  ORF type:complete len:115 (-),score=18.02 GHRR01030388.1:236-580(-)